MAEADIFHLSCKAHVCPLVALDGNITLAVSVCSDGIAIGVCLFMYVVIRYKVVAVFSPFVSKSAYRGECSRSDTPFCLLLLP